MSGLVACVDFGSTFTKALLVSTDSCAVLATADTPTTASTDVLTGWYACRERLSEQEPAARRAPVLACSSAGGGLRIAVVGNEELVTAEAGRRVALSSGGTVVHVGAEGLADGDLGGAMTGSLPDVVLLVGGTDGGNAEVVMAAAERLVAARWEDPVVVACNDAAAPSVEYILASAGIDVEVAANVVPQIGMLRPAPARAAIRAMFLRHVIGGKRLSASAEFLAMVQGPTPDLVLSGVEVLATVVGDVAVVDVGGATTDVYSVVEGDPEEAGLARQVVAVTPVSRTVEGDLGMRWSAATTVAAARDADLLPTGECDALQAGVRRRAGDIAYLPSDPAEAELDLHLAELAVGVALRRHAGRQRVVFGPDGRLLERTGTDLREIGLLVGSGGVLRHTTQARAAQVLAVATGDDVEGGWLLPRAPRSVIDTSYVLAAAGLLRAHHDEAARVLVQTYIADRLPCESGGHRSREPHE